MQPFRPVEKAPLVICDMLVGAPPVCVVCVCVCVCVSCVCVQECMHVRAHGVYVHACVHESICFIPHIGAGL